MLDISFHELKYKIKQFISVSNFYLYALENKTSIMLY